MKIRVANRESRALTVMEVLILVAVLSLAGAYLLTVHKKKRDRAIRIHCISNLNNIGLAFKVWASDNGDQFPMQVSITNGGTMELVSSGVVAPHFQIMSNELNSPRILFCPGDTSRIQAINFQIPLAASNVSYFIGLDATDNEPQRLLVGDEHFTVNGTPPPAGLLNLWTNSPVAWTAKRHSMQGNIGLADCSVRSRSDWDFQNLLAGSGLATNRLAMP